MEYSRLALGYCIAATKSLRLGIKYLVSLYMKGLLEAKSRLSIVDDGNGRRKKSYTLLMKLTEMRGLVSQGRCTTAKCMRQAVDCIRTLALLPPGYERQIPPLLRSG